MKTNRITCFIASASEKDLDQTISGLKENRSVRDVQVLNPIEGGRPASGDYSYLNTKGGFQQTETLKLISEHIDTEYVLLYTKPQALKLGYYAVDRMLQVAEDTGAGLLYADCYQIKEGKLQVHPLMDYQQGSLRDDFDFGSLLLYKASDFKLAVARMDVSYTFAALYDLRLKVSQTAGLAHLSEYLYTELESDTRKSGEKIFDYVDPRNRAVQIEMEAVCTQYLKETGAWLKPVFPEIRFQEDRFPVEATVVIPVRNREKTIKDAVLSVLKQETSFAFNLIVVNNHSTDNTTTILNEIAAQDDRLIHVIPDRDDLGIGGCWNMAVMHPLCGKFAIQLDSDDLYIDEHVIAKVVSAFYEQQSAMIVGTYKMVNFKLEEIPPGIIDHKEWTPDNGRNNALRINGLGAPRAFYTPVLREIKIPNTSYGEDYAVGLAISRRYQIGRIYEPLYLCRRWDDNSDASLDIHKMNAHNLYKDKIRTIEYLARIQANREKQH